MVSTEIFIKNTAFTGQNQKRLFQIEKAFLSS